MRTIDVAVLERLSTATYEGNVVRLNCGQLSRPDYEAINKVLEALGGKWNRKLGGHAFEGDAAEALEAAIMTGTYTSAKDDFGYFPTPAAVVEQLLEWADLEPGMMVLEPSAGRGNIADALKAAGCAVKICEIQQANRAVLEQKGYEVIADDFLSVPGRPRFDRIVMNPPFGKQADIDHILHAWQFLNAGGILVSVASSGVMFRENKKTVEFREFVARNGFIEQLGEDAFKESGTLVRTVAIVLKKTA